MALGGGLAIICCFLHLSSFFILWHRWFGTHISLLEGNGRGHQGALHLGSSVLSTYVSSFF